MEELRDINTIREINRIKWDQRYRVYKEKGIFNKYPAEHIVVFMAKNYYKVVDRSALRVLEIGCGSGCNLVFICREGFSAYGLDYSQEAISLSQEFLKMNNCHAELSVQNAIEIPYPDNFFDACIESNSIHCNTSEDIRIIFNAIFRVLKKGGKFFGTLASDRCDEFGKGRRIDANTFDFTNVKTRRGQFDGFPVMHFFSKAELESIGRKFSSYQLELNVYTLETAKERSPLGYWFVEFEK